MWRKQQRKSKQKSSSVRSRRRPSRRGRTGALAGYGAPGEGDVDYNDVENSLDAGYDYEGSEGESEGSGSDIANGCDHLTEIGAFMTHAKELAWCLENDPELELGLYAPLVALAETRAVEAEAAGDQDEYEAAAEVVRAARRARARRGRSGLKGGRRAKVVARGRKSKTNNKKNNRRSNRRKQTARRG